MSTLGEAFLVDSSLKLIVESLLFASGEPLTPQQINSILPEKDLKEIRTVLAELQGEYKAMNRSFTIREVAKGFQFCTLPRFRPYISSLLSSRQFRLSRPALETLAIIAYRQPIIRQEIEQLRGVDVGGILKMLLKKGLVRIVGRKPLPGRPIIYGTTRKFLEVFDLKDLSLLPTLKEIEELGGEEDEE